MSCIQSMGLTSPQVAALLDARPRVLVAAGAGSGKTRLLVACVVQALVEQQLPIDRVIAVTFTRKAGLELVSRIRSSLEECGRLDLARSLDTAAMGTIHSLCRRLVKDRSLEAGVDPACAVLEAEAAALLKEQVGRQVWDSAIERAGDEALAVLASQGDSLRREMISLYDRLRGMGDEVPQVVVTPGPAEEQTRATLETSVRAALEAGRAVSPRSKSLETDLATLTDCLLWLEQKASGAGDTEEGAAAPLQVGADLQVCSGFFPSRLTRAIEPHFEPVREALSRYRCSLAEARLRPLVQTMNELLVDFHRRYTSRKDELGLVDFADLELKARALVAGPGAKASLGAEAARGGDAAPPAAPPAALPAGSLLLIDEFQDTNELQCSILEGLGAARMLIVGDERQSIYRFRGADVDVFRRREAELGGADGDHSQGGVHRLDVNYRSSAQVLGFINRLFAHESFFGARFKPLEPDAAWASAGRELRGHSVEVVVACRLRETEDEERLASMQEAEAEAVAARVRRFVEAEGWQQRDIVVLLPTQTYVNLYRDALRKAGVEVYVVRGKGYYSQEEVADVTSLLRLVVNPHDDLALVSVLRSPLVGLSDDGLYLLGKQTRATKAGSLWGALQAGGAGALEADDRQLLDDFAARLGAIRQRVGRPGLARLIEEAIDSCSYDLCLLTAPEGPRRFANVRKLMRLASEYEALNGPDLPGFVDLLRDMDDLGDREGSAPTLAEGQDVVRVMTVHQAKGLEFPVVVLAGLGSDVSKGTSPAFAVGSDKRIGVFLKGSQRKTYESGDLCWGPAREIVDEERAREREEDVRLLYVAMTRARERLVLVGAGPTVDRATNSRIGRIVSALGLEAPPAAGEAFSLEGLDAVVTGVGTLPPGAALGDLGGAFGDAAVSGLFAPETPTAEPPACPQFLDMPSPGGLSRRVSFSALAAYQRCPRQFYLERVLGLAWVEEGLGAEPDADEDHGVSPLGEGLLDPDERHAGRDVGLLVHALLERVDLADGPPPAEVLRRGAQEWVGQTGTRLSEVALERALELTRAFWRSPSATLLPTASVEREVPFFFAQGETVVSGIMDLLAVAGGGRHIVDYKTNALAGRASVELAAGYRLQGVVYCLAALRAGATAVQMDFVFLERPEEPVTMRFTSDELPILERELDEALEGLRQGRFAAEGRAQGGDICSLCAVAGVCAGMARP